MSDSDKNLELFQIVWSHSSQCCVYVKCRAPDNGRLLGKNELIFIGSELEIKFERKKTN